MTLYMRQGSRFQVTTEDAMDIHHKLPADTFTVKRDQYGNYFLEKVAGFEVSGKIYGDAPKVRDRILNTFLSRSASTGVLLSGDKGSGKTLQAQLLSKAGLERGIPTIVINAAWHGEGFNAFMQTIDQPTIVIFDEFEKVYGREEQEALLTLLDGVYPSKKMFILTCNNKMRVNEHMINRPGRIFYRLDYDGLDLAFIEEYCKDKLNAVEHTDSIARLSTLFYSFSFDILKALIEEMNRYDEAPLEAMKMLNAKPEMHEQRYDVKLSAEGREIPLEKLQYGKFWHGNPLIETITIEYFAPAKGSSDEEIEWESVFNPSDIVKLDAKTGDIELRNGDGDVLVLAHEPATNFNYAALL